MIKNLKTTVSAAVILLSMATSAQASNFTDNLLNKENWMLRVRMIDVMPAESSTLSIADKAKAGNAIMPEIDFTYFWTKNWASELILATSEHHMSTDGGLDLGDVWILPPTLTMQYHFRPDAKLRPYAGAGVNYTIFYGEGVGTSISSIEYDDGFGFALQAGFDYGIDKNWAINFDVKKIWLPVDISINGGAITGDVDLDPWIFGTGISYRF